MADSIAVVTPTYNMGCYLTRTIESVLGNLCPNDQYFVVDGGSTDESADVIRRYESRLTGWVSEPDRGYADALAKGFSRATSDIFCWINAGDLLLPGALDAARKALAETRAELIFGDDFYIDENSRIIFLSRGHVTELRGAMLYGGWTPLQDACFWTRDLYRRVGGIDSELRHAADYDLFLRMALQGKCAYVPITFSSFRRHPGQKSITESTAYRAERRMIRCRELARLGESPIARFLKLFWHGLMIRWRVYVQQQNWRRDDLVGLPIDDLQCRQYWPKESRAG